jgi:PAS domain-containing protein
MTTQTTPNAQAVTMTDKMNLSSFIRLFDTPTDAIDYILACNEKGLVQVSENTLPVYRLCNGRFIAYSDWQPQTHSFDVRIQRWSVDAECSKDAVVRFDYTDGIDLYWNQLSHDLAGVTDESEMHWQDNIETHNSRERDALALQVVINNRRLARTRIYLIEKGATITPNEFEQHCVRVVEMREENNRALKRIEYLDY